jgi:hypothetical protein
MREAEEENGQYDIGKYGEDELEGAEFCQPVGVQKGGIVGLCDEGEGGIGAADDVVVVGDRQDAAAVLHVLGVVGGDEENA